MNSIRWSVARRKFWSNYIVYWHFCIWFIAWFRGMNITEVLLSYHTSDGHLWHSNSTPQPKIWDQFCTQQLETRVIFKIKTKNEKEEIIIEIEIIMYIVKWTEQKMYFLYMLWYFTRRNNTWINQKWNPDFHYQVPDQNRPHISELPNRITSNEDTPLQYILVISIRAHKNIMYKIQCNERR